MEVNSQPPVIDFEALLQPISEDKPSGESLQYSGIYDEIREARRADDNLSQGDWQHQLKTADFRQVIDLATGALASQTKDLQIAVWLGEALTKEYGFIGLRDSLRLISEIQENFWNSFYPEIEDNGTEEGDMEARANFLEWFDRQCALALKEAPITDGEGIGFIGWEDSKQFNIPDNLDSLDYAQQEKFLELKQQAERENRVTAEKWLRAKNQTRRLFYEELSLSIEECWTEYEKLDKSIEQNFESRQMPALSQLKKSLDAVSDVVKKLLAEKRQLEPSESDNLTEINETTVANENSANYLTVSSGISGVSGAIKSRQDALNRLAEVAEYFRKTEPNSPISPLVQRAVRWGNMSFEQIMREMIKDESVLTQIRETLGIKETVAENSEDSSSDW